MSAQHREALRRAISEARHWPRQPKPDVHRDLTHGWLLPVLVECESRCWGRWSHWVETLEAGHVLDAPIPQIEFGDAPLARKMHENSLNHVSRCGSWQGWSSWKNFDFYLDWLLFAFGDPSQKEPAIEPEDGASDRLYQTFCIEAMLAWPHDVFGELLAENAHGRHSGFYPTPHCVVEMMVQMNFGDTEDSRALTVCDPALGTGRMLLHASNFSYRLSGMDIDRTVLKAALVNGYCFAPWMVKPLPFFDVPSASATVRAAVDSGHPQTGFLFPDLLPTPARKSVSLQARYSALFEEVQP